MKTFITILLLFVFSSIGFAFDAPKDWKQVTKECYLEVDPYDGGSEHLGRLHCRGLQYTNPDFVNEVAIKFFGVEGVSNVIPAPYQFDISIGRLYTWDEVLFQMGVILNEVNLKI
ncbi:MAG: hypothetical protein ACYTFW_21400 [Planctomycetota bacterium]